MKTFWTRITRAVTTTVEVTDQPDQLQPEVPAQPLPQSAEPLPTKTLTLQLQGMHCVACAMLIDDALEEVPGVVSASTSFAKGESKLVIDPTVFDQAQATAAIEALGYEVM